MIKYHQLSFYKNYMEKIFLSKHPMVSSNNFVAAKFSRRIDNMCVMVIHVGEHK